MPKTSLEQLSESVISYSQSKSVEAESFRVLRTNIQFIASARELKTLLITSTAPGEGKSTIVANLAVVLAQTGKKVLVVDADLRSPVQHRLFKLHNYLGLSNVLNDGLQPGLAISATLIPGLYLLSSGPIPVNPAELIASDRMGEMLSEFKEGFDFVLIDVPPLLAVTEGVILSSKVDGVLFVVKAGNTRVDKAQEAVLNLQRASAQILGVILNNVERTGGEFYYYDYYSRRGENFENPKY